MIPDWSKFTREKLNDGKYHTPGWPEWPGYVEHPDHPLGYNNSLTFPEPGSHKISNQWSGTDSPEAFEKHKKEMGPDWRYLTKEIVYNVNSSGYRTYEWDQINWEESIIMFGDSCTYGIGLAEDETIPHYLEEITGRQVVNLGFPGGSNPLILDICAAYINKFPMPYATIINWSTTDRFRYWHKNGYMDLGPWVGRRVPGENHQRYIDGVDIGSLWANTFVDRYNQMMLSYSQGRIADAMWKGRTRYVAVSYFSDSVQYLRCDPLGPIDREARDLMHPSYENAREAANVLAEKLKNK